MSRSLTDVLLDVTHTTGWLTIDDLVDGTDAAEDFDWFDELDERSLRQLKKVRIRHTIKKLKDETGMPVLASIMRQDGKGGEVRGYKQETMFNLDDYRQVTGYYADRANYHATMARRYAERAQGRFGVQLPLMLTFGPARPRRGPRR